MEKVEESSLSMDPSKISNLNNTTVKNYRIVILILSLFKTFVTVTAAGSFINSKYFQRVIMLTD